MKGFLEAMKSMSVPDFQDIEPEQLRKMMEEARYPKEVEDVKETVDMTVHHHGVDIPVRLYVPERPGHGLIIYLHGGGFVFGSIRTVDALCRKIANLSGQKVISVEYRLAPEHKFPAAVDDAYESVLWAFENSRKLGVDSASICVAGDSAGGNLAVVSALRLKDNSQRLPKLVVMFYPTVGPDSVSESHREYGEDFFLRAKDMQFFGRAYLNSPEDALNPYFAPILHPNLSGLPETIIVTAENDPLRDQAETFAWKLDSMNVPVTCVRANGMIHGFENFFSLSRAAGNVVTMIWKLVGHILH
ncbi:alpha/beta hydrolase [Thermoplasmatales archaeon AK]|nr:alpha/beta hydrolase [Thermoplasmatales archaeon AK]